MWQKIKKHWLYHLAFEDDSVLGWTVHLALAFIIIKFLVYPALGLLLGTKYPIVAVVSCSMDHRTGFDQWWMSNAADSTQAEMYERFGITKEIFRGFPFRNGFWKGDLMMLSSARNAKTGDVIVFFSPRSPEPVIHRVIAATDSTYTTKGDANQGIDPVGAKQYVQGKAILRIPFAGWVKLGVIKAMCIISPQKEVCRAQAC